MADKIDVHVKSSGMILSNPNKFATEMIEHADETMIKAGLYVHGELIKATPVGATGDMRRRWNMEIFHTSHGVEISITNSSEYFLIAELGRKAAPVSVEGRKSLELWVRRKLGISPREAPRVAFLIARKKAHTSTPGQFFARDTIARCTPVVAHFFIQPRMQAKVHELEGTPPKEIL